MEKTDPAPTTLVPFPGATIAPLGPNEVIVEMLEKALEEARSGHLIGLGIVKVERQPIGFVNNFEAGPDATHSLAAGLIGLLHRVGRALNNE